MYQPDNEEQLTELIQHGLAEQTRFAVQGFNSKSGFGYEQQGDAVISTSSMTGILEYDPAELVMQARAGTSLKEIVNTLDENKQYLAFEPMQLEHLYDQQASVSSIGGTFAANLSGSRRFVAGAARDHLLGFRAVNGRGEAYRSGGNVIKNVTGYDLSKLLCGSWGTLSVMSEISFKVLPKPFYSASLVISDLGSEHALKTLSAVAQSPLQSSGLTYLPSQTLAPSEQLSNYGENFCALRFEGTRVSVDARIQAAKKKLSDNLSMKTIEDEESITMWEAVTNISPLQQQEIVLKLSIAPSSAPELIAQIENIEGNAYILDAAGAWIWLSLEEAQSDDAIVRLRETLAQIGGSLIIYKAPLNVKQKNSVYSTMSSALASLQQGVKASFDPTNILNPGRLGFNQ